MSLLKDLPPNVNESDLRELQFIQRELDKRTEKIKQLETIDEEYKKKKENGHNIGGFIF